MGNEDVCREADCPVETGVMGAGVNQFLTVRDFLH